MKLIAGETKIAIEWLDGSQGKYLFNGFLDFVVGRDFISVTPLAFSGVETAINIKHVSSITVIEEDK